MPVLDRQPVRPTPTVVTGGSPGDRVPDRIPETAPTPLQRHYINLSAVALVAGAIGITLLESGADLGSPLVKLCALVAGPLLVLTTADASLRIWRSAWAWMPLDRGRGLFRLTWVMAGVAGLLVITAGSIVVVLA
jgi:hypothetical protein